jgi:hypothetical protein
MLSAKGGDMTLRRFATAALCAATLAGCSILPSPTVNPEPTLPTVAPPDACRHLAIKGVLRSDPHDAKVAWLEVEPDAHRQDVVWPIGYKAKFVAIGDQWVLQVFDGSGQQLVGTTDVIGGACDIGRPDVVLLEAPFS